MNEISDVMKETMSKIKEIPEFKDTPIIVSTGSNNQEDEKHALSLGAWDFVF